MSKYQNDPIPVFVRIENEILRDILTGRYSPGEKLKPIRDLASELQVNPNTLQRALSSLESRGILYTQSTVGKFVTSDIRALDAERHRIALHLANKYISNITDIGYSKADAKDIFNEILDKEVM